MAYVFIGGIPASGKSHLAQTISNETGTFHFSTDNLREEFSKDPQLERWVNFYLNLGEKDYYTNIPCKKQWENLVNQSEALWPKTLESIKQIMQAHPTAVFEGVNILPHLAKKDLDFPGIFLLGESVEQIFGRNKENPRWGRTEELQKMEAEAFFHCEGKMYKEEAEKYGYKTFRSSEEAKAEVLRLLGETL